MFENQSDLSKIKNELKKQQSELMILGLVENPNSNGFEDRETFKLSDKAKAELLGELNIQEKQAESHKDIVLHTSLAEKTMFYNQSEESQIEQLSTLLKEENFKNVQQRLADKGMRTGFACLFHGSPGTGKTETVYQIARQTGRDIFMVDISQTKSMWFGESEKKIKDVFDRYKYAVKESKLAPILLFNEADAVINKRQEIGSSSVDKTENAIQNILLQEMENIDGIMIATTNLTKNLDKAFERRFLYKIEFNKPNIEAKKSIWQSIIPELSSTDADTLANRYDFSGGQIENIARKATISSIINGHEPDFENLESYCKNEILTKERPFIGFGN
jgi:SpoVK/Ycf46/Vps4 family AAA+-type ATPase